MIERVTFASCYVYSPGGSGSAGKRSRMLCAALKAGDARFMVKYADRVRRQVAEDSTLYGFLDKSMVLVPVPACRSVLSPALQVTTHLALALIEEGLGRSLWAGLQRIRSVRKSATAPPGSRPTVANHYESFVVQPGLPPPARIVLIDDVVTKGRTMLAAAARLHDEFPEADIRAFALLRTMGFSPGVSRLLDPCVGEIRWRNGDAIRVP